MADRDRIDITTFSNEGLYVLRLNGELDASNAVELDEKLKEAVQLNHKCILVDCMHLRYISSAGIGVIVSHLNPIVNSGGKIGLLHMSVTLQETFRILGLHQILEFFDDLPTAKEYLNEG